MLYVRESLGASVKFEIITIPSKKKFPSDLAFESKVGILGWCILKHPVFCGIQFNHQD